jgi:hypothetical protein
MVTVAAFCGRGRSNPQSGLATHKVVRRCFSVRSSMTLMLVLITMALGCFMASAPSAEAFHYTCSHQTTWWYYNGWWHRLSSQWNDSQGHWHEYQIVAPGSSVNHWRDFACGYVSYHEPRRHAEMTLASYQGLLKRVGCDLRRPSARPQGPRRPRAQPERRRAGHTELVWS